MPGLQTQGVSLVLFLLVLFPQVTFQLQQDTMLLRKKIKEREREILASDSLTAGLLLSPSCSSEPGASYEKLALKKPRLSPECTSSCLILPTTIEFFITSRVGF